MPSILAGLDFQILKQDFSRYRFVEAEIDDPEENEALAAVDKFAFTSNNVTYVLAGDKLGYWSFFPAEEGWGTPPVWGFGDVIRSRSDEIAEGERVYGFFPLSTHLRLRPVDVQAASFVDGTGHRRELPPVYNRYSRLAVDPMYASRQEGLQAIFRPLFTTSFLLDDYLADNDFFGARTVILSSASSKTAFGTAFVLDACRAERSTYEILGLTSPGNAGFVEGLGVYDRVVTYDEVETLASDVPVAFIDVAGNGPLRDALHHHYQDDMKHDCHVGLTHWQRFELPEDLPGAEPKSFFAPAQAEKRIVEWGAEVFQQRLAAIWCRFLESARGWVEVSEGRGTEAVERVYLEMFEGRSKPDRGHILSLGNEPTRS